ncbi:MAG TPA: monovalent cation/H+ antiporter complex subunit F [Candidatus Baltobacteraceae bacterium]|jgi:multisubunit Na+/H+ antiporter MnhF subunit|nr:monovalent cation/H+ antiporter complex subunit F [Candidatus Baltobacteraceae bacterium]
MNHTFNGMLFGTELLFLPMLVALYVVLSGESVRRVIALQLLTMLGATQLVLLSIVFANDEFADAGVTLALLSIGGTVCYVHFLERWL